MEFRKAQKYRVIFVIVSWNRKELLDRCLFSLKRHIQSPFLAVVVDNASQDGTREMVRARHPEAVLIESSENLGFSRANNLGLEFLKQNSLQSEYVVFLNNDVRLEDGSLERLFDYLDRRDEVKAAVPAVWEGKRVLQTGVGGFDLSLKTAFLYFIFLSVAFPGWFKGFFIRQEYFRRKQLILELEWISGVCLVVKRQVLDRLSGWPEHFFMYAEDVAFSREVRRFGKLVYFPAAQVFHFRGGYEYQLRPGSALMWLDSLFEYYRQRGEGQRRPGRLLVLKSIFFAGFLMRIALNSFGFFLSRKESQEKMRELWGFSRHILKGLI